MAEVCEEITLVCVSDTHTEHPALDPLPEGDILLHAGDWTRFGDEEHVTIFNEWLGTLNFKHKIIVNGNHECNAPWKKKAKELLSNGTLLIDEATEVMGLRIHGTQFYWPLGLCAPGASPYSLVEEGVDILMCHGPAKGYLDGNDSGCLELVTHIARVKPQLFVCGHIHGSHGEAQGIGEVSGVHFVNAAICNRGYKKGFDPVVVKITPRKREKLITSESPGEEKKGKGMEEVK